MNKELINFLRELTVNDTKTLTQKALKTTEEVGELAKAILPFENAAGTLHRFSDKKKILENVVDVFLTSISIAYELGFTDDEVDEMINLKSKKWAKLQHKEGKVKYPLPYEIHISIKRPDNIENFKEVCEKIRVKAIVIDLEKDGDLVMQDVMTSSVHFGDNRSAYEEANRIKYELTHLNEYYVDLNESKIKWTSYTILRTKIETVPWHPAAPNYGELMPKDCYLESHLRVVAKKEDRELIEKIAKEHNAHLSRNFFKKLTNDQFIIMVTLRSYTDYVENFHLKVDKLKENLVNLNFTVDKIEVEFAIYDTKISHDYNWIN